MFKEDCGCEHDGTSWTKRCDACRKFSEETSARWAADRTKQIEIKCHRLNGKVIAGEPTAVDLVKYAKENGTSTYEARKELTQYATPTTEVPAPTPKGGTKLEQALAIYKELKDRSRKNVIAIFVKELNMTPAGASTYQYTCKQKLGA